MIKIGTLYPSHLDLNGDSANALVVSKQLTWRGVENEIIPIEPNEDIPNDLDFLVIGHGSPAAWASLDLEASGRGRQLTELLESSGCLVLAINSGYEILHSSKLSDLPYLNFIADSLTRATRVSKFHIEKFESFEVLGYLNTDASIPVIKRHGKLIGTMLHGPVLAKNPLLLDLVISEISLAKGIEIPDGLNENVATEIGDYVSGIWKLERELASE